MLRPSIKSTVRVASPTWTSRTRISGAASAEEFTLFSRPLRRFRWPPAQNRLARRRGLIEPSARRKARRGMEWRGIAGPRPLGEAAQHRHELIERGLALGLGRL